MLARLSRRLVVVLLTIVSTQFGSAAGQSARGETFVLQCTEDERLQLIEVRVGDFGRINSIAIRCLRGSNQVRTRRIGRSVGEEQRMPILGTLQRIHMTRGRCHQGEPQIARVCSLRFELANGLTSVHFGVPPTTANPSILDGNGEIYGISGRFMRTTNPLRSAVLNLGIVTRKLEARDDNRYDIAGVLGDIRQAMRGVMGYAAVIRAPDGTRAGFVRAGWAIHPRDPEFAQHAGQFDVHTIAAVGSTVKAWATAVAVARVDEQASGNVLDRPFSAYLPVRWRDGLSRRFTDVTVRQVLTHRGGFRRDGPSETQSGGVLPVRFRLQNGEIWPGAPTVPPFCAGATGGTGPESNTDNHLPAGAGPPYTHCYSNSAGGMFHFLLAGMASDPELIGLEFRLRQATDAHYDKTMADYLGRFYEAYVQQHILGPSAARASCTMADFLGNRQVALGYRTASTVAGWLPPSSVGRCASGGWVISMNDLSNVLHKVTSTGSVLATPTRLRLHFGNPGQRLWDSRSGNASTHTGLRRNNGRVAQAAVVVMHDGYVAALAWNSERQFSGASDAMIVDAFEANRR